MVMADPSSEGIQQKRYDAQLPRGGDQVFGKV